MTFEQMPVVLGTRAPELMGANIGWGGLGDAVPNTTGFDDSTQWAMTENCNFKSSSAEFEGGWIGQTHLAETVVRQSSLTVHQTLEANPTA